MSEAMDFPDPNPVGREIYAGNTPMQIPDRNERLVRAIKNPLDKCTIVSIFPKEILQYNPTIEPGRFYIKPGSYENPETLTVGSSSWWNKFDSEKPAMEMIVSSIQVANSVIMDWANGLLGYDADSGPGLFFVLGEVTKDEIKLKYRNKLDEMKVRQDNWYKFLVKHGDALWARSNGNPLVIWDTMRLAARSLNMNDKPWLKDFITVEKVPCKACGGLKDPAYPVCPFCKAVDMTHPAAKDLKFALP